MWTFIIIAVVVFFIYHIIKWHSVYPRIEAFVFLRLNESYQEYCSENHNKQGVESFLQFQYNSMVTIELSFIAEKVDLAPWRTKNAILIATKKFYQMNGISTYLLDNVSQL